MLALKQIPLLILLLLTLTVGACNYKVIKNNPADNTPIKEKAGESWYQSIRNNVIEPACFQCHGNGGSSGGVNLDSYESTKAAAGAISNAVFSEQSMPPSGAISDSQKAALKEWLDAGAPLERPKTPNPQPQPDPKPNPEPQPDPKPDPKPTPLNFEKITQDIFKPKCLGCHSGEDPSAGLDLSTYEVTKTNIAVIRQRVLVDKDMPPSKPLIDDLQAELKAWIDEGAPEGASEKPKAPEAQPAKPSQPATPPTPPVSPQPPSPLAPHLPAGPLPGPQPQDTATFTFVNEKILVPKCLMCHSPQSGIKNIPRFDGYEQLMSSNLDIVVPFDPEDSGLIQFTTLTCDPAQPNCARMPPKGFGPLTPDEISAMREWIQKGALNN